MKKVKPHDHSVAFVYTYYYRDVYNLLILLETSTRTGF